MAGEDGPTTPPAPPTSWGPPSGGRRLLDVNTPASVWDVKSCPRCKETKPSTAFSLDGARRDGLFRLCRTCKAARKRIYTLSRPVSLVAAAGNDAKGYWYSEAGPGFSRWLKLYRELRREHGGSPRALSAIRKYVLVLSRGGRCSGCGYDEHLLALDFDHVDPSTKAGNVSGIESFAPAYVEAQKCRLLCSNCHRLTITTPEMDRMSARLRVRVPLEIRGVVA